MSDSPSEPTEQASVVDVLNRVRSHAFHPVNQKNRTVDRHLDKEGIVDLDDEDWKVRLLAVRDLVRAGRTVVPTITDGLSDEDVHVRYVCATALGVIRASAAVGALERVVRDDPDPLARSQAAVALGQIGSASSVVSLRDCLAADQSKDVRHRIELAIDQIEKGMGATDELAAAYRDLDPATFNRLQVGDPAPAFTLPDTEGTTWRLSDLGPADGWTVLIWVFADWCPVCHREFAELIDAYEAFEDANVTVATLECHDVYRSRVMVGKEVDPAYWFAEESFMETYVEGIWWRHLVDRAGAVGATYGVDPMAFAVHAEYINRPATIVIDPAGIVRFAYYGTYWGDRPSIEETLEMIRSGRFDFEHPERRVR